MSVNVRELQEEVEVGTSIIQDNIDVELQMGEARVFGPVFWDLVEAEVEVTQIASPNYVKGRATVKPESIASINRIIGDSELGISAFVGQPFVLRAETDLVMTPSDNTTVREINEDRRSEDTLLFRGNVANISPVGTNLYEFIAYDPGQQSFNVGEESGSILNKKLELSGESVVGFRDPEDAADNNITGEFAVIAENIVLSILEEVGISGGEKVVKPNVEGVEINFKKKVVPVKDALDRVREQTNSEWWFDKDGIFYFGNPAEIGGGVEVFDLKLIKNTSAGIDTPPYQSVKVIGSGIASSDGWANSNTIQEDPSKIVKRVNIGRPSTGGQQAELVLELDPVGVLNDPTFEYINAEISSDEQAQNTAIKIANDLIKQQASGTVTILGAPEVEPFDGIRMPDTRKQPMGGQLYEVYAVRHKLNPSDGFVTEIEVAGPSPTLISEINVEGSAAPIPTSTERDVFTPDGERRAFGPGAGPAGGPP